MTTKEYTPRPWQVRETSRTHNDPERFWETSVVAVGVITGRVATGIGSTPQEAEANGRLIAAAPELLAAVEYTLEREYNPFEPDNQGSIYFKLKNLIGRAKGQAA